jgi:hypothetical protein
LQDKLCLYKPNKEITEVQELKLTLRVLIEIDYGSDGTDFLEQIEANNIRYFELSSNMDSFDLAFRVKKNTSNESRKNEYTTYGMHLYEKFDEFKSGSIVRVNDKGERFVCNRIIDDMCYFELLP